MAKTKLRKRSYKRKAITKADETAKKIDAKALLRETHEELSPDHIPEIPFHSGPEPVLQTTEAHPENRMMRYARNPRCPKCDVHPVVCMMRQPKYKKFRCRICGYMWEVTDV